jgi:hypothetical protein
MGWLGRFRASALLVLLMAPTPAGAVTLGELIERVDPVRALAHSISSGLSQGVREEADRFVREDIDPLLTRVDGIIAGNIERAFSEASELLTKAEQALGRILDRANGLVLQDVKAFFDRLHAEVGVVLDRVDQTLTTVLCELAPYGRGLYVSGIPFQSRPDSITVWWPLETACFARFSESVEHPTVVTLTGEQYYEGMTCELELSIQDQDPSDRLVTARTSDYYRRLAGLKSEEICVDHITGGKVVKDRLRYEKLARIYDQFAAGSVPTSRR